MSACVAGARPSLEPHEAAGWSEVMDILFGAGRILALRKAEAESTEHAKAGPAGILRLLLALTVIAAIVGLLERAATSENGLPAIASTTVQHRVGAPQ